MRIGLMKMRVNGVSEMKCKKKKICNICEATFKMEIGCNLEKRCPACRLLRLQHSKKGDYFFNEKKELRKVLNNGECRNKLLDESPIKEILYEFLKQEDGFYTDETIWKEELREQIFDMLKCLNDKEQFIIKARFGFIDRFGDDCIGDISKELGITRERVRQIEGSAIRKLKRTSVSEELYKYLSEKLTMKLIEWHSNGTIVKVFDGFNGIKEAQDFLDREHPRHKLKKIKDKSKTNDIFFPDKNITATILASSDIEQFNHGGIRFFLASYSKKITKNTIISFR